MLHVAQQILNIHKTVLLNTFAGVIALQNYSENMLDGYLGPFPWITEGQRKPFAHTIDFFKKTSEGCIEIVNRSFNQ